MYQTIISAHHLAENLHTPNWLILDCRGQFIGGKQSYSEFVKCHIENAYYCCFSENYLPNFNSEDRNPYQLDSSPQIMLDTIAEHGIEPSSQIVIYDNDTNSFTDTLWLQLRSIGCLNVAVLQGGLNAWKQQGFSVTALESQTNASISA